MSSCRKKLGKMAKKGNFLRPLKRSILICSKEVQFSDAFYPWTNFENPCTLLSRDTGDMCPKR